MSVNSLIDTKGIQVDQYSRTQSKDAIAGRVETDKLKKGGVQAFKDVSEGETREVDGREIMVTTTTFFFKIDSPVAATDMIKVGIEKWDVEFWDNVHGFDHHIEVHAVLRQ